MPTSAGECKDWIRDRVSALAVTTALDVGPGSGTYRLLLPQLVMDAVEVWEPYVVTYNLRGLYRSVWIADFLDFDSGDARRWDLVILGDIIEHFDEEGARACWDKARELAGSDGYVVCSTPVVLWPQGHEHGNPYEEHKFQFDWEGLITLPGVIDACLENPIGAVLAHGR